MKPMTIVIPALCLAGCAAPVAPAVTSDSVMAVQYRARGADGAMTGAEAGLITQAYQRSIAAPPAAKAAATPDTR